jgi:hypothetical protein
MKNIKQVVSYQSKQVQNDFKNKTLHKFYTGDIGNGSILAKNREIA